MYNSAEWSSCWLACSHARRAGAEVMLELKTSDANDARSAVAVAEAAEVLPLHEHAALSLTLTLQMFSICCWGADAVLQLKLLRSAIVEAEE